jgi:uncharacterized protein (DUF1778 family)
MPKAKKPTDNLLTDEEIIEDIERSIAEGTELKGWKRIDVKVSKNLTATYGIRMSPEELRMFTDAAKARGMRLSDFMRAAARAAVQGELNAEAAAAVKTVKEKAQELVEAANRL